MDLTSLETMQSQNTWFDKLGKKKKMSLADMEKTYGTSAEPKSLKELDQWTPEKQEKEDREKVINEVVNLVNPAGTIRIAAAKNLKNAGFPEGKEVYEALWKGFTKAKELGIDKMEAFSDEWFEANKKIWESTKVGNRGAIYSNTGHMEMPFSEKHIDRAKLKSSELEAAIPESKQFKMKLGKYSFWNPETKSGAIAVSEKKNTEDVFAHEVFSHGVQGVENRAKGGHPATILKEDYGYTDKEVANINLTVAEAVQDIKEILPKKYSIEKMSDLTMALSKRNANENTTTLKHSFNMADEEALKNFDALPEEVKSKVMNKIKENAPEFTQLTIAVQKYYNLEGEVWARAHEAYTRDAVEGKVPQALTEYIRQDPYISSFKDIVKSSDSGIQRIKGPSIKIQDYTW